MSALIDLRHRARYGASPGDSLLDFGLDDLRTGQGVATIEQVVGLERNQPAIRLGEVNAGFLQGPQVKIGRIHELDDQYPENVLVGQFWC